jgi:GntR family transcriptional regulator
VFLIDPDDPTPLYAQLEWAIRAAIARGELAEGERLPTVRQLAVDLRVNANTVARVYADLERKGVLETRRGVGSFVAPIESNRRRDAATERQLAALGDRFLAEAARLGYSAEQAIESLHTRRTKAE